MEYFHTVYNLSLIGPILVIMRKKLSAIKWETLFTYGYIITKLLLAYLNLTLSHLTIHLQNMVSI